MYKLIETDPSAYVDQPPVVILDDDLRGSELIKRAADDRIQEYVRTIEPRADKSYLHINAMTAGEFFGSNRNGDYFPEENLVAYYKTFETSPAHVFRSHINKDPEKSMGKVLYAIYNERMHRVELIAEVSKELAKDVEEKILKGEFPFTSMACKTPYDICSICGNKASSREEYCSHLKNQLGQLLPDGRRVMAINSGPLKFFDISIVIRPADVTSSVLQKVASNQQVVGSAQLAEEQGVTDRSEERTFVGTVKQSALDKLSELTKIIEEGNVVDVSDQANAILDRVEDPDEELLNDLASIPTPELLNGLAETGISPSLGYLAELFARKYMGEHGKGTGRLAILIIQDKDVEALTRQGMEVLGDFEEDHPGQATYRVLTTQVKQASLLTPHVISRAMEKKAARPYYLNYPEWYDKGRTSGVTPDMPYGQAHAPVKETESAGPSFWQSLAALGGIAIASKLYIDSLVRKKYEKQLEDQRRFEQQRPNEVKINIEKTASDKHDLSVAVALGLPGLKKDFRLGPGLRQYSRSS